jgi:CheY-like chemotaxis protein
MKMRALVVEDEAIIAMMIEDMVGDLGHDVVARAGDLAEASAQARTVAIDFAILDVNLDGQATFPVAEILAARGIPFVFATGYGATEETAQWADAPTLQKPFQANELAKALERVAGR